MNEWMNERMTAWQRALLEEMVNQNIVSIYKSLWSSDTERCKSVALYACYVTGEIW